MAPLRCDRAAPIACRRALAGRPSLAGRVVSFTALALLAASASLAGCAPPPTPPAEPPVTPMPGVKTLERAPEGGLRYRLYLGERATPEAPERLVVWMHPSGPSMNRLVEPIAPELIERGYGLLIPIGKPYNAWLGSEANQLVQRTLPDAATVPGVDARRPILMGFSAGANMALNLWAAAPTHFGGLILDCAAPRHLRGAEFVSQPEPSPALRATPIFLVIGEHDRAIDAWREATPAWIAAGVPLTTRVVPGEGHTFLLHGPWLREILAWLP